MFGVCWQNNGHIGDIYQKFAHQTQKKEDQLIWTQLVEYKELDREGVLKDNRRCISGEVFWRNLKRMDLLWARINWIFGEPTEEEMRFDGKRTEELEAFPQVFPLNHSDTELGSGSVDYHICIITPPIIIPYPIFTNDHSS